MEYQIIKPTPCCGNCADFGVVVPGIKIVEEEIIGVCGACGTEKVYPEGSLIYNNTGLSYLGDGIEVQRLAPLQNLANEIKTFEEVEL